MVRTTHLENEEKEMLDGQKYITYFLKEHLDSDGTAWYCDTPFAHFPADRKLKIMVSLIGALPQLIAFSYFWATIASHAGIELRSENVVNAVGWISDISIPLSLLSTSGGSMRWDLEEALPPKMFFLVSCQSLR